MSFYVYFILILVELYLYKSFVPPKNMLLFKLPLVLTSSQFKSINKANMALAMKLLHHLNDYASNREQEVSKVRPIL